MDSFEMLNKFFEKKIKMKFIEEDVIPIVIDMEYHMD